MLRTACRDHSSQGTDHPTACQQGTPLPKRSARRSLCIFSQLTTDFSVRCRCRWRPVIDGILCGIDDRTSDRTHIAIVETLPDLPRWVYYYRFDGFGNARTRAFQVCGATSEPSYPAHPRPPSCGGHFLLLFWRKLGTMLGVL